MKVAFRVDASSTIGIGHLRRCLALASALETLGTRSVFVTRDLDVDSVSLIEAQGFAARRLAAPNPAQRWPGEARAPMHAAWAGVPQLLDAEETCVALEVFRADWVVVDHYAFERQWHERVASHSTRRLCVIDDLADRPLRADLLVDHNPAADHRAKYAAQARDVTRLLGGPRYALLGPAYATAPRYEFKPRVESIGIFMGGTDTLRMSELALRACREIARFDGPVQVATTTANPNLDDLRRLCSRSGATELVVDLPDLTAFFRSHDLQIGAAGGAAWERCCIGVPSLTLKWADNQSVVLDALEARGVVRAIPALTIEAVGHATAELVADSAARRSLSEKSREWIDGRGAERVALALFADEISLRPATIDDAAMAHAWRNNVCTRRHFRDPAPVRWDHHLDWWTRTLYDDQRRLFVAQCSDRPVGTLRFDFSGHAAEISLYIDPALTGLGLGRALLAASQRWIATQAPHIARIVAEVRPDNAASARAFDAAGFSPDGPRNWLWECPR